jgi:hypothetical protein
VDFCKSFIDFVLVDSNFIYFMCKEKTTNLDFN